MSRETTVAGPNGKTRAAAGPLMILVLVLAWAAVATAGATPPDVRFEKQVLTDQYYCDGINVGDFNRDGAPDIVAGPYWYEGPSFQARHEIYPAVPLDPAASPSNSLYSFVHDFSGDGWPDVLVLGRVHLHEAAWYENPGAGGSAWRRHYAFPRVLGESPAFTDIDLDGRPELVAHWEGRWGLIAPDWQCPTEPWDFRPITERRDDPQFYHGTGVGDLNGDGRPDLILNDGWYEQPAPGTDPQKPWTAHLGRFSPDRGGAQMLADDVDGDGDNDVYTALDAHGWGLSWFEQVCENGRIIFRPHRIMGDRSEIDRFGIAFTQPHALALADLDGDGRNDLITGKRRWAHGPTGDIEPDAPPVVVWFRPERLADGTVRITPHLIDDASGVGTQITTADVDGDGRIDVLTASKLGCFLFRNREVSR